MSNVFSFLKKFFCFHDWVMIAKFKGIEPAECLYKCRKCEKIIEQ